MKSILRGLMVIAILAISCVTSAAASAASAGPRAVLDRSFGDHGVLRLGRASGVRGAATSDGGLLIGGGPSIHVIGAEGAIGGSFGADPTTGLVTIPPASGDGFELDDFTVDAQGRIVAVGSSILPESENPTAEPEYGEPSFRPSNLRIVRLLPGGGLDPDFGHGGVVETDLGIAPPLGEDGVPLGTHPALTGTGIAVDPQGRIVITGSAIVGFRPSCVHDDYQPFSVSTSFFLRLEEDGRPDDAFGHNGLFGGHAPEPVEDLLSDRLEGQPLSEDPLGAEVVGDPVIGPDGQITYRTVGYFTCTLEKIHRGIGRLTATGSPDRAFGKKGALHGLYGDIAGAADGSVIALVGIRDRREEDPVKAELLKIGADGKIDRSFGRSGRAQIRFGADASVRLDSVVVERGGRILVGGHLDGADAKTSALLVRFTAGGRRESRFGPHGRVATRTGGYGPSELFFDPQGRLLSVDTYREDGYESLLVARYLLR